MATRIFDQNNDPVVPVEAVASPDQQVADVSGNIINPSEEDGNLLSIKTNTDNLDVLLSSRASELTLSSVKSQTDLLTFDTGRLVVDGSQVIQPISAASLPLPTGAATESTLSTLLTEATFAAEDFATETTLGSIDTSIDVLLSTRASEATLSSVDGKLNSLGQKASTGSAPVVIASDQSVIPVQGNFANGVSANPNPLALGGRDTTGLLRTTSVTNILGQNHLSATVADVLLEQATLNKTYTASAQLTKGNTETATILVRNPAGSGKKFYLSRTFFDVITKGNQATWRFYASPTVSATGTAITPRSTHLGGGAPASVIQVFSNPTASPFGTRLLTISTGADSSTIPIDFNLGTIVEPGFDALLTCQASANNTDVSLTFSWVESA